MTSQLKNIRESVDKSGFTVTHISKELDLSRNSFYQKLNGKHEFTLEELKKLAKLTGKPLSFFIDIPIQPIEIKKTRIPVVSMAKGGDSEGFEFEQLEPHEYEYIDFEGCLASKVTSNSMAPALFKGQKFIYDPKLSPVDGDLAYVKLKSGEEYVKRFRRDAKKKIIVLESINTTNDGTVLVADNEISFMYCIVGASYTSRRS